MEDPEDIVTRLRLRADLDWKLAKKRMVSLELRAGYFFHARNDVANYPNFEISVRWDVTRADLIHGGVWDENNSSVTGAGGTVSSFRSAYHKGYGVDDADRYGPAMPDIIDLMQRIDDHNEAVKA